MIKGFFRLAVITTLLIWVGVAVFQWLQLDEDMWLLEGHISPYLRGDMSSLPPTENYWPVFAATPKFLALSDNEKVDAASNFYEQHVRSLENLYFVGHDEALKKWFIETARSSLNDAPIRHFPVYNSPSRDFIAYRDFGSGVFIAPRLSYVLFDENQLGVTAFFAVAFNLVVILTTLLVRWVYKGFTKK